MATTGSMASTLGLDNPYRYRGYRYDTETGLYYLQSRYYNPQWGRFVNADEPAMLGLSATNLIGANLFAYCNNNPVMDSDPSGYGTFKLIIEKDILQLIVATTVTGAVAIVYGILCAATEGLAAIIWPIVVAGVTAIVSYIIAKHIITGDVTLIKLSAWWIKNKTIRI